MVQAAHVEAVPKRDGKFELLGNSRVRIDARGEFVLDHEDSKNLYIVIYAVPADVAPTFAAPKQLALTTAPIRNATGAMHLTDIGQGLPHQGQWRDQFAVGDLLADGSTQMVFGAARKSGSRTLVFREKADAWQRVDLRVPPGHYDYGGVAIGDFDGDGRNDLALAMHLTGFSVLRAMSDGTFDRIDTGLPNLANGPLYGSGHAVLALPAPAHDAATLLLLLEPAPLRQGVQRAPSLAAYRYAAPGFTSASIGGAGVGGNSLAFAPASHSCRAKLASSNSLMGAPIIWETADEQTWSTRAIDSFPDPSAVIGAVALGDLNHDGCSDFAVAYSSRSADVWHSVVDVYLDRGASWARVNLLDAPRDKRVTAISVVNVGANLQRALLVTLDGDGTLRAYDVIGDVAELVIEAPPSEWRKGCPGSDIHALPNDAGGHSRMAASFAGEPTMGQFDRCRRGGGIEAWRID
jgi:hypothetical protein